MEHVDACSQRLHSQTLLVHAFDINTSRRTVIPHVAYHLAVASGRPRQREPATRARRRKGPLVLAADLETLARGKPSETARLSRQIKRRPHTSVVYAAPQRSQHATDVCVKVLDLPEADVVIADGGASVRSAQPHPGVAAVDSAVGSQWPGAHAVRMRVRHLGDLIGECRFEDARRVSFVPGANVSIEQARTALENALSDLRVDLRVNAYGLIDVLPHGTNMTKTVMQTLRALHAEPQCVVAAGGFIEPRLFAGAGYWGIATAETPATVRADLVHDRRVHMTHLTGPDAVLDGLLTWGFLARD